MSNVVLVNKLSKYFKSQKGQDLVAVDNISFEVQEGESVGFIGPNGAGKSTTIKMLSGILYPSTGTVTVAGLVPSENRQKLSYRIGCVFGQRSQLLYNLPPLESLYLFGKLYGITGKDLSERAAKLVQLLGMEEFLSQPVRKLSLGQRMRAEIACSLIHNPEILFLDEPTIGLDITAKRKLRKVLRNLNELGTTIFLTSHDMGDIESLCERTLLINHGRVVLDMPTKELNKVYGNKRIITVDLEKSIKWKKIVGVKVLEQGKKSMKFEIDLSVSSVNSFLQSMLAKYDIADVDIDKPSLETVIEYLYEKES
ncbi:MAG: ATP-binding cassette domain-containing protein [Candidatus Dojkabacteria bacterium]|nr:MAG: ATP-binding cassette domain-containing protein [Candidatus Dojkabacteria bacterium]